MKIFITSAIISILYLGVMCAITVQPSSLSEAELRATALATGQYFDPITAEILYVTPFATLTPTAIAASTSPAADKPVDEEDSSNNNPPIAQLPTQLPPTLAPTIVLPTATAIPPTVAPTSTSIPATATPAPTRMIPPAERLPTLPPSNANNPPGNVSNDDDDDDDDSEGGQPRPSPAPDQPTPIPNIPKIAFSQPVYQVVESELSKLITVNLNGPINQAVAINYTIIEETATEKFDYQAVTGQLTFTPNQNQATFSVPIIDDNTDDPITETARLILSQGATPVNFTRQTATLEIMDNDSPPTLQFSHAAFSVIENQPSHLTVTLSHPSGQLVSVGYGLFNQPAPPQPASPTEDYQDLSFGLLNFGPDHTGNSPTTITFTWSSLVDDQTVEPPEQLSFKLKPPFNATLGQLTTTTLTIFDNDGN